MIVEKLDEFLKKDVDRDFDEVLMYNFSSNIVKSMKKQFFKKSWKSTNLYLSGIGKCLRSQAYHMKGLDKPPLTPRSKMTFAFGDLTEEIVVLLLKHAGCVITDEQELVVLNGVRGRIDGILHHKGKRYLFECKSMSDTSFNRFKQVGMSNDFGYVSQANSYAHEMKCDGIIWFAFNKNTGHYHEEVRDIDKDLVTTTVADINALNSCKPEDFPRPEPVEETFGRTSKNRPDNRTGNWEIPIVCQYCDYVEPCYGGEVTKMFRKGKLKLYLGDVVKGEWTKGGKFFKVGEDVQ